jgi:hypothetical protein
MGPSRKQGLICPYLGRPFGRHPLPARIQYVHINDALYYIYSTVAREIHIYFTLALNKFIGIS